MANKEEASSSSCVGVTTTTTTTSMVLEGDEEEPLYGSESGWVEALTSCDHLASLASDLIHIPTPDSHCNRCHHPKENWLCLYCKDVLCSRFINKHMLEHYRETNHCVALSYSDLSVWCFSCDSYLDAQVILALRPVYETAYLLKFGEAPPFRTVEFSQVGNIEAESSTSSK
ncbi:Histone deacetylase 6 [Camellia lanceoleosa]|uniref:Histone deacetylase 6 n=1 Tax=Camellia lanceoleosa TaxID=1840588 RepID=A0ACC0FQI0_9ERIC|nr:Histone deacetylase 6 [Camellia lanceoleosa]